MTGSSEFDVSKDYYGILGVVVDADKSVLKSAFFRLAKELHPDKTGGDLQKAEKFKEVREAYEILSSPELREQYDRAHLSTRSTTQASASTYPGNMFGNSFSTGHTYPTDTAEPMAQQPSPDTPAARCKFSDYYFSSDLSDDDWIETYFLYKFRLNYENALDDWEDVNMDIPDFRRSMFGHEDETKRAHYRALWENARRRRAELVLQKRDAKNIWKEHRERAKELLKRRNKADARVRRADAARKRSDQLKKQRASRN